MTIRHLAVRFAPVLLLLLNACDVFDEFAREFDLSPAGMVSNRSAMEAYRQGLVYLNGDGVERDEAKAAGLFVEAADKGSRDAAFQLGLLYQRGAGVPQHDGIALEWFEKAASMGHPEAQLLTGQAYATGRGASRDSAWAARWYGKAADQGLAPAQHLLGMAYARGQGLPRDQVAAYQWLSLAAAQKDANAGRERAAMAKQMTKKELKTANARVRKWHAQPKGGPVDAPTVRFAQVTLGELGFEAGPVDGLFGPRTRQALSAYQAKAGIETDGALTAEVVEKLKTDHLPGGATVARSMH